MVFRFSPTFKESRQVSFAAIQYDADKHQEERLGYMAERKMIPSMSWSVPEGALYFAKQLTSVANAKRTYRTVNRYGRGKNNNAKLNEYERMDALENVMRRLFVYVSRLSKKMGKEIHLQAEDIRKTYREDLEEEIKALEAFNVPEEDED